MVNSDIKVYGRVTANKQTLAAYVVQIHRIHRHQQ